MDNRSQYLQIVVRCAKATKYRKKNDKKYKFSGVM